MKDIYIYTYISRKLKRLSVRGPIPIERPSFLRAYTCRVQVSVFYSWRDNDDPTIYT